MAATTSSALASAPPAISPLISTTAVCGALLLGVPPSYTKRAQATAPRNASQVKRQKMRQRRAARCSLTVANTSFSSTSRSQPGGVWEAVGLPAAGRAVAAAAHKSGAAGAWPPVSVDPGRWGSVMVQNSTGCMWGAVCQRTRPSTSDTAIFTRLAPRHGPSMQRPVPGS